MAWSTDDIPSQTGRTVLITGATDGLGKETALALGAKGATVIVAGRNRDRGQHVVSQLPSAMFEPLDLSSLDSVREFATRILVRHPRIDLLVANAGISMPPTLQRSPDGFELQMAVNYFGHFALTAALMPALSQGLARIVTVSSLAAARAKLDIHDLNAEMGYTPIKYYALSKLSMILFAQELDLRSRKHGWNVTALSAHPGFSRTNLGQAGPKIGPHGRFNFVGLSISLLGPLIGHSAAAGALPILYAGVAKPEAEGASYVGPGGPGQLKGPPKIVSLPSSATSSMDACSLWETSERLTGTTWPSAVI